MNTRIFRAAYPLTDLSNAFESSFKQTCAMWLTPRASQFMNWSVSSAWLRMPSACRRLGCFRARRSYEQRVPTPRVAVQAPRNEVPLLEQLTQAQLKGKQQKRQRHGAGCAQQGRFLKTRHERLPGAHAVHAGV